jgi:cytochrome o ubiquinol oxidase operon protein cyoD
MGASSTTHTHQAQSNQHGSLKSYLVGFFWSLVLTLASFGAVMSGVVSREWIFPILIVLAVAQLLVQLSYFLHISFMRGQRTNTAVLICTIVLIVIMVVGSLWVMHNANVNMMPHHINN